MCLFLAALGLHGCLGVSAVRRVGPSPVEVPGLLTVAASPIAERGGTGLR